jgi:hypothetical protein
LASSLAGAAAPGTAGAVTAAATGPEPVPAAEAVPVATVTEPASFATRVVGTAALLSDCARCAAAEFALFELA